MFPKFQLFFSPEEFGGGGDLPTDLEILEAPDEKVEEKPAEEPKSETKEPEPEEVTFDVEDVVEEKKDEEKPKEEVPEDPDDREVSAGQLRFKDVKAKYPNIFKEMPQLATAIRNDRAYSEIFPDPEAAREAAQIANYFNNLQDTILKGSPKELLKDIQTTNKDAYKEIARNFLPTIREDSMELFAEITLPVVNDVLRSAIRDAEGSENTNLKNAALHIAKYLYGKPEIPELGAKKDAPNPEAQRLQQERQQFWQEKAQDFSNECFTNGREETLAEIAKGIDNDKSISPFLKSTLKEKIFNEVDSLLGKDVRHLRQMNALWKRAESTGFPKEARREIINAYLRGAKALIPAVRQKFRAEAGLVPPTNGEQKQETTPKRTNIPQSGGKPTGQAAKVPSARDVNWGKTSDLDFLNGKYTPKRRS